MKRIKLFLTVIALVISAASAMAQAQGVPVRGSVRDAATGEEIPFAAVMVKGSMNGVSADADGYFSITAPSNGILVFSSVGYVTVEVEVASKTVIDVYLQPDAVALSETIVVAYGTATKESFTGSASMVGADDIAKRVTTSVTSALAGTTTGVQVLSGSGDPANGNTATIRIRGIGSMSASNSPLYIVDGMPFDGSISDINPNDVESMSVLKDASASAIYGARGANGVILITTKKAESRDAQVKVDMKLGSNSKLMSNYDVITDPGQYYETWYRKLYNQKYYNGSTESEAHAFAQKNLLDGDNGGLGVLVYTVPNGQNLIGTNFKLNPNATLGYDDGEYYYYPDNWYNETYSSSFRQEYNISVSGANQGFNYYASVGYLSNTGIVYNSGYERYSARANVDYQAKKWLKITSNMGYSHTISESNSGGSNGWGSSSNVFYITQSIAPIYPLYKRNSGTHDIMVENGLTQYDYNDTNQSRPAFVGNAVGDNYYNSSTKYKDSFSGKWGAVLTPIAGLDITANLGVTNDNVRYNKRYSPFGYYRTTDGYVWVYNSRELGVTQQYLASYKKEIGKHSFDVLAGWERYKYTYQYLEGENDHLYSPYIGELNNALGSSSKDASSYTTYYMTMGFLARAQYDYAKKYFISGSYRRDASSRFASGHRWGDFGSAGAAWVISSEPFLANVSWIDLLKVKASYGVQGNDNLGSYFPYSDKYSTSYNEETGEYSASLTYVGNEDLTWETSHAFNAGVDFDFFRGRLGGTVEFFNRKTTDLLYSLDVPLSAGNPVGDYPVNVGSILNRGVELSLNGTLVRSKNVTWDMNVNLTHYINKILSLDESVAESGIIGSYRIYEVGGSLYDAYMYKYAGVDYETGKALYWYHDDETDEDLTTTNFSNATKYRLGSILPKLFGGFGTSLKFYNFDFSVQFSFQLGGRYYDSTYQNLMKSQDNAGYALHKDILNAWTEDNRDTNVPRLDDDASVSQNAIDRFLTSSDYLSIDAVTLGYNFPKKLINKAKLSNLRIYVSGDNLYVKSARKGLDPRYSSSFGLGGYTTATNSTNYSSMRTVIGGITLTF